MHLLQIFPEKSEQTPVFEASVQTEWMSSWPIRMHVKGLPPY